MKIPTTQVAAWLEKPHPEATLLIRNDIEVPQPRAGEILVNLLYTGFCHSDIHYIHGDLPSTTDIPGHEGVGRVVKGSCILILNFSEPMPYITDVEFVTLPAEFATVIPEGLEIEATAPLLCAGVTMFGALRKLEKYCQRNDWVVILGAGGGLGHL
ncbi:hypothetical protein N7481_001431 [Penicillium waksmanii]|uniref:uncharacterized protein n=1 Tax=Penicillium waksmanii TaxID=69791 RepID=UPI0025467FD7|nr:uncharacterized protein N7481_001431 [Penicillium waksmanii]KAJ6001022.1 hypothetical protein N7481_001431 [Penicillium waksmanii]